MLDRLANIPGPLAREFLATLNPAEQLLVANELFDWENTWARKAQLRPEGNWSVWAINAGRGFGKTRTGAETMRLWAQEIPGCRMALVARTHGDLRDVMIEGRSGLLATAPPWFRPKYESSKRRITWPNGSQATTFTSEEPDDLRGPEFHYAWCDELASWTHLQESWSNLQLALRIGERSRTIVTTTPRPLKFLRSLYQDPMTRVTGGSTYDNAENLPAAFLEEIERLYGGPSKGRQEIYAEILQEAEGALWKRKHIEQSRVEETPDLTRIVVAIDPAVSSNEQSDETGIVAVGTANIGRLQHFYVLQDVSGRYSPFEWGAAAFQCFEEQEADRIIGEVNNGGDMVESTLRTIAPDVPYRAVHASRGKAARAEPIAALYEQGRVHHVGAFEELEDQLANWVPLSSQRSPDRLDALVWAVSELIERRSGDVETLGIETLDRDGASPWRM